MVAVAKPDLYESVKVYKLLKFLNSLSIPASAERKKGHWLFTTEHPIYGVSNCAITFRELSKATISDLFDAFWKGKSMSLRFVINIHPKHIAEYGLSRTGPAQAALMESYPQIKDLEVESFPEQEIYIFAFTWMGDRVCITLSDRLTQNWDKENGCKAPEPEYIYANYVRK